MRFVYIYIDSLEIRAYSTLKKLCLNEGIMYDNKKKFKESENIKKVEIL